MAVSSGSPVLLQGVHLGKLTGRIQLGDQIDSKKYPAVTNGYWVLMEDIDYAPMEFRVAETADGNQSASRQAPLSRSELKLVSDRRFPKLETVVDRLLDIYFLLSAGNHQGALEDAMATQEESVGKFLTRDVHSPTPAKTGTGKTSSVHQVLTMIKCRTFELSVSQSLQVQQTENALAFTFVESLPPNVQGTGDWVLLDEINLAAMETLECLSGLLESTAGSILLMERGDLEPVVRHPNFRLFACMNPATDVGKKDLSPGIRNRFTELYVDELEDSQDLKILVCDYLRGLSLTAGQVDGIVKFYLTIRGEASRRLTDGTGHPPHYSLRTLCRALKFAAKNSCDSIPRSLYELDRSSHPVVEQLVSQHAVLKQALPAPTRGRWVGDLEPFTPQDYILTPSVRANLRDLATPRPSTGRDVMGTPVCASITMSTQICRSMSGATLQTTAANWPLKKAMKLGHWIILDELNLAPSDVLEALNRLLDDNRELFIPETQETVKAHSRFMLFATQNPPGHYGGRKVSGCFCCFDVLSNVSPICDVSNAGAVSIFMPPGRVAYSS
ncbi:hypothetical protein DPMN_054699 [Dreissena polymorpha]|uniref:Midasin n=1 Tax=Dreissena polymorpha TaxID=45954 RepID=A0A9D4CQV6_DREPO|nr:hypothetical protein DPMN_054699 [Dreissena polymorpha]